MGEVTSTLHEVNSFLRTVLMCVMVGGVGYGGGWLYQNLNPSAQLREKDQQIQFAKQELQAAHAAMHQQATQIQQLDTELQAAHEQITKLDTAMRYLKVDRRVAELHVLRQMVHPGTGRALTEVAFQELNADGVPIEHARRFVVDGDLIYIDYWVAKFADRFVEQADEDRSTSICLFRRLFGEFQEPHEGFVLDEVGARPTAYGRGNMSAFEQSIWDDFWNLANDPARAEQLGIRALHGEAVSIRAREGARYRVQLRAAGGLSISPIVADGVEQQVPAA